jgi:2-polyprenyl-3-methyl-5-hydroxy-6-metoxy-1,4-benzoquinol methylase
MKRATARTFLSNLQAYRNHQCGKLLDIGCGQGELLQEAEAIGYEVTGVEFSQHAADVAQKNIRNGNVLVGNIEQLSLQVHSFDVVVSTDVIEHLRNPREHLEAIHKLLKPGGVLMMVTISLDSWTAQWFRHRWMEFKIEHLTYFSNNALQSLLLHSGFRQLRTEAAQKTLTAKYILAHFERYPVPIMTILLRLGYNFLPNFLRNYALRLTGSGVMLLAQAHELPKRRKLSIIIPAYNEATTFSVLMNSILNLDIDDIDIEYIIVESNSTDGTRELALGYVDHPQVTLVLQDKPQGKGFAVRAGLERATGDFVVIQDADLEYDLNDYPKLLMPLIRGERTFVLGSRHSEKSAWNMRQFEAQQVRLGTGNPLIPARHIGSIGGEESREIVNGALHQELDGRTSLIGLQETLCN